MANKRLSVVEQDELKKMVSEGKTPDDIAKHFNIAISSVHNWKKKFKTAGLKAPSVRGRKPIGVKPQVTNSKQNVTGVLPGNQDSLKFIVNGVSLQIEASARSVNIGKSSIQVDF